ncbi:MAG: hypothetical protein ACRDQ4_02860 [Pseudonocardiaceae bacterium]
MLAEQATSPAYPMHPNALGMHEVADLARNTLSILTATRHEAHSERLTR